MQGVVGVCLMKYMRKRNPVLSLDFDEIMNRDSGEEKTGPRAPRLRGMQFHSCGTEISIVRRPSRSKAGSPRQARRSS
jgi:hypothetical protein